MPSPVADLCTCRATYAGICTALYLLLRTWVRATVVRNLLVCAQALAKIKTKHADTNFTLTLPEYEEILDALVGSHFQNVPSHYSHTDHDELGKLLVGVSVKGRTQHRAEP